MTGREGGGQASQRMTRADGKEKVYFVVTDSACTDVPSRTPAQTGRTRSIMHNPIFDIAGDSCSSISLATVPARNRPFFGCSPCFSRGSEGAREQPMHSIDKLRRRPSNPQAKHRKPPPRGS